MPRATAPGPTRGLISFFCQMRTNIGQRAEMRRRKQQKLAQCLQMYLAESEWKLFDPQFPLLEQDKNSVLVRNKGVNDSESPCTLERTVEMSGVVLTQARGGIAVPGGS